MDEKINGRTPEEIKRWVDGRATCNTCPKEHEVGCEYGHITASENNPDTDCNWECLCTDENIKWFNEPEPPKGDA